MAGEEQAAGGQAAAEVGDGPTARGGVKINQRVAAEDDFERFLVAEKIGVEQIAAKPAHGAAEVLAHAAQARAGGLKMVFAPGGVAPAKASPA